jgi:hypothetical protein
VDQSLLVKVGQNLLTYLDREGAEVDTAAWIFSPETQWRLWLAPKTYVDRHSFYLTLARVMSKYRPHIGDLEISDVQIIEPGNPLVWELKKFRHSVGPAVPIPIWLTSARLGGYYLPEGIILKAA